MTTSDKIGISICGALVSIDATFAIDGGEDCSSVVAVGAECVLEYLSVVVTAVGVIECGSVAFEADGPELAIG